MRFFLASLMLFPCMLFAAQPSYYSKDPCFIVTGEWLYFAPISETSYYAATGEFDDPILTIFTERQGNRFDHYHSGWRLGAAYVFDCNRFVSATWSQLKASHSDSISGGSDTVGTGFVIAPILGQPGQFGPNLTVAALASSASDRKEFSYHALDVVLGQSYGTCCWLNMTAFAGIHYAYLSSKEEYAYAIIAPVVTPAFGKIQSRFWGVGPELGFNLSSCLGCGFFLEGTWRGALIIGKPKTTVVNTGLFGTSGFTNTNDNENEEVWRAVPYTNIRLQLRYVFSGWMQRCGCNWLYGDLVVGYEAPIYFDALDDIVHTDAPQIYLSFDNYRNVIMHGPFIGLTLGF